MDKRVILGIISLIITIVYFINSDIKKNELIEKCTAETTGTIVNVKKQTDLKHIIDDFNYFFGDSNEATYRDSYRDEYKYTYYPVIKYNTGNGEITKKFNNGVKDKNRYRVGSSINILYVPSSPKDSIIKGEQPVNFKANLYGIVFTFCGIGAVFAFLLRKGNYN